MRLEEQIRSLENIGLTFFDFVTSEYLKNKYHWKEWWHFEHPPFQELMIALFVPHDDELLTDRYVSLDLESPLPNAYSLLLRKFAEMASVSGDLKILEEHAELSRIHGYQQRTGYIRYQLRGQKIELPYSSYFDTMDWRVVTSILRDVGVAADDREHRFYYVPHQSLFYLTIDAESSPLLEHLGSPVPFPME